MIVRVAMTIATALTLNLPDLILGFLLPAKKLRLYVLILSDEKVPPDGELPLPALAQQAVENAKRIYKKLFNINIIPYSKNFIEIFPGEVPGDAQEYDCAGKSQFQDLGDFFNDNLAGWVGGIPITLTNPITVFVINNLKGEGGTDLGGCSIPVLTDYVILDRVGLKTNIALSHEMGHACGVFWHSDTKNNLMYKSEDFAGEEAKWFQKNIIRSSRHVWYW